MRNSLSALSAIAAILITCAGSAAAQSVQVAANGTLGDSTYTSVINNDLTLNSGTSGFNFSGTTGSFALPVTSGAFSSASGAASANGYYYADFLISINGSSAESVTTSLQNTTGVSNLSERIYSYDPSVATDGFLGDTSFAAAGIKGIQVWSANFSLPGTDVSVISPTDLTAGSYVIEMRGNSAGNFGGTLSVTSVAAVPEPTPGSMLLTGLGLLAFVLYRRKAPSSRLFQTA